MTRTLLFTAMGLSLLAGAGLGLRSRGTAHASADQVAGTVPKTDWLTANGKTEGAREELALRPEITGTIRVLNVKTNQDVRKGDLLVELENDSYQAQVLRAEAQVKRREADQERARDAYERLRRSGSAASPADLRHAEFTLRAAAADWGMAKAELLQARTALAKTRLLVPWDGRVLQVFAEPGTLVGPTSPRILLMADVSRRRVRAYIEELDALRVRVRQAALVKVDGTSGKEFTGRVSEVLLRMDRDATRSDRPDEREDLYHRPVLIDLDDGHELPLNQRVDVRIQVTASDK
jgi:RND family efflux transporter MFP subunit